MLVRSFDQNASALRNRCGRDRSDAVVTAIRAELRRLAEVVQREWSSQAREAAIADRLLSALDVMVTVPLTMPSPEAEPDYSNIPVLRPVAARVDNHLGDSPRARVRPVICVAFACGFVIVTVTALRFRQAGVLVVALLVVSGLATLATKYLLPRIGAASALTQEGTSSRRTMATADSTPPAAAGRWPNVVDVDATMAAVRTALGEGDALLLRLTSDRRESDSQVPRSVASFFQRLSADYVGKNPPDRSEELAELMTELHLVFVEDEAQSQDERFDYVPSESGRRAVIRPAVVDRQGRLVARGRIVTP